MADAGNGLTARDVYGFRLDCTPEEMQARQSCEQKQAHQLQAWEKYWKRKQLPSGDKLKKLCRKVRLSHCQRVDPQVPVSEPLQL